MNRRRAVVTHEVHDAPFEGQHELVRGWRTLSEHDRAEILRRVVVLALISRSPVQGIEVAR